MSPSYQFRVHFPSSLIHLSGDLRVSCCACFVLGGLTITDGDLIGFVRSLYRINSVFYFVLFGKTRMPAVHSIRSGVHTLTHTPLTSTMSTRAFRQLASTSSRTLSLRSSLISARARVPAFSPLSRALPATRAAFSLSACRFGEGTSAC